MSTSDERMRFACTSAIRRRRLLTMHGMYWSFVEFDMRSSSSTTHRFRDGMPDRSDHGGKSLEILDLMIWMLVMIGEQK